jgi:hypothetical protein
MVINWFIWWGIALGRHVGTWQTSTIAMHH